MTLIFIRFNDKLFPPMARFRFLLPALLFATNLFSQDQLGLRLERFSGISSAPLNPANLSGMALKWDVQLIGIQAFIENNYAFIHPASSMDLLKNRRNFGAFQVNSLDPDAPPIAPGKLVVDFYEKSKPHYATGNGGLMLPGFAIHLDDETTVGFSSRLRAEASSFSIPGALGYPSYDRIPYGEELKVPRLSVVGMLAMQESFHYSRRFQIEKGLLDFGVSAHLLQVLEAGFARGDASFFITKIGRDTVILKDTEFDGGITTSNFDWKPGQKFQKSVNGFGAGLDIGAVFTADGDEDEGDYRYKIGASLLDIGHVFMNKNTQKHRFWQDSSFLVAVPQFGKIRLPDSIIWLASERAFGDPHASLVGDKFSFGLPMAISLQADVKIMPEIYVSGVFIQRLTGLKRAALMRPNLLAVTPRMERRWWSASLPIILSEYKKVRVGAAVRLGFLLIGTDHLGSFTRFGNWTGTDFYLSVKINSWNFWGENARTKIWHKKIRCPKPW